VTRAKYDRLCERLRCGAGEREEDEQTAEEDERAWLHSLR